ncbi:MAG TPA: hypothetical protein H9898_09330, partial [Candidatus Anaerobiospirillum stercoravium]|nr:hypothetical protein [Candidatus Anaerobiospirillum stercoravium]
MQRLDNRATNKSNDDNFNFDTTAFDTFFFSKKAALSDSELSAFTQIVPVFVMQNILSVLVNIMTKTINKYVADESTTREHIVGAVPMCITPELVMFSVLVFNAFNNINYTECYCSAYKQVIEK